MYLEPFYTAESPKHLKRGVFLWARLLVVV